MVLARLVYTEEAGQNDIAQMESSIWRPPVGEGKAGATNVIAVDPDTWLRARRALRQVSDESSIWQLLGTELSAFDDNHAANTVFADHPVAQTELEAEVFPRFPAPETSLIRMRFVVVEALVPQGGFEIEDDFDDKLK